MQNLIEKTCKWLLKGDLDPNILAEDFHFSSPFHKEQSRADFIENFKNQSFYQDRILSGIHHFDPVIKLRSEDGQHFAIVLQYHMHDGQSVWETVVATVNVAGKLTQLRSIYDLAQTNKVHGFE